MVDESEQIRKKFNDRLRKIGEPPFGELTTDPQQTACRFVWQGSNRCVCIRIVHTETLTQIIAKRLVSSIWSGVVEETRERKLSKYEWQVVFSELMNPQTWTEEEEEEEGVVVFDGSSWILEFSQPNDLYKSNGMSNPKNLNNAFCKACLVVLNAVGNDLLKCEIY